MDQSNSEPATEEMSLLKAWAGVAVGYFLASIGVALYIIVIIFLTPMILMGGTAGSSIEGGAMILALLAMFSSIPLFVFLLFPMGLRFSFKVIHGIDVGYKKSLITGIVALTIAFFFGLIELFVSLGTTMGLISTVVIAPLLAGIFLRNILRDSPPGATTDVSGNQS